MGTSGSTRAGSQQQQQQDNKQQQKQQQVQEEEEEEEEWGLARSTLKEGEDAEGGWGSRSGGGGKKIALAFLEGFRGRVER